ncbi:ABC transporter substrate-binding protein [Rhodoplanes sp. Z2-YC6860]|uniref:ABC transporter substrate-binding protein n=1 Tax=Rhodoplanes sp. Z2-YC6860 TaxID=674703 RepID=UPI0018DCF919|nr:ABC transporter substrate-binding protein [Rhodoplanes sp. Z2-YC6860]
MRRREFLGGLGATAAWAHAGYAQQPGKVWRMGFLAHGYEKFYDGLFDGLKDLGYQEGRNLNVERRYAEGRSERFKEFATEMVRLKVDVIVVSTTPAGFAVKSPATDIPVVFPNAISPIESGLIGSLAHPGGNITGGAAQTAALSTKRLEILKEVVPRLSRVAVLWNGANPALSYPWKLTQDAADQLHVKVEPFEVRSPKDIETAFAKMTEAKPDALIVLQDALTLQHRKEIIDFTVVKRLPGMFVAREWVTAGGLMSYGENLAEMYRRGAYFVDKILKGAKPADLPVEQVTKFEMIINLKTAQAMGWTVPPEILATADDVIE